MFLIIDASTLSQARPGYYNAILSEYMTQIRHFQKRENPTSQAL
jgi:hypothetical protein